LGIRVVKGIKFICKFNSIWYAVSIGIHVVFPGANQKFIGCCKLIPVGIGAGIVGIVWIQTINNFPIVVKTILVLVCRRKGGVKGQASVPST
jgi:hypothetical protein